MTACDASRAHQASKKQSMLGTIGRLCRPRNQELARAMALPAPSAAVRLRHAPQLPYDRVHPASCTTNRLQAALHPDALGFTSSNSPCTLEWKIADGFFQTLKYRLPATNTDWRSSITNRFCCWKPSNAETDLILLIAVEVTELCVSRSLRGPCCPSRKPCSKCRCLVPTALQLSM